MRTGRPRGVAPRPGGGPVAGVRVGRPGARASTPASRSRCAGRVAERLEGRQVVHVADVLAQPGVAALGRRRRCSSGRRRPPGSAAPAAAARPAAGRSRGSGAPAPRGRRRPGPPSRRTGTWIGRSCRSQASASGASRVSASSSSVGDRLAAQVAATSSPAASGAPSGPGAEQQRVQRRVRQQHARGRGCRAPPRGRAPRVGVRRRASRTIGRAAAGQQRGLRASTATSARGRRQVGHHDGERLVPAALAAPQRVDGSGVAGVAGQVVAAEALDRDDPPPRSAAGGSARSASSPRRGSAPGRDQLSRGPQSGQAIGWAWKRRSAGSAYSRGARRAHRERRPSSWRGRS